MNEFLKPSGVVDLEDGFTIESDTFKGLVLKRVKQATRNKKGGGTEECLHTEQWYFPKMSQTLSKYLELKVNGFSSIEDILTILVRVEEKIDSVKETWE